MRSKSYGLKMGDTDMSLVFKTEEFTDLNEIKSKACPLFFAQSKEQVRDIAYGTVNNSTDTLHIVYTGSLDPRIGGQLSPVDLLLWEFVITTPKCSVTIYTKKPEHTEE